MYTSKDFQTKKALKNAINAGEKISIYNPGFGQTPLNGSASVEGPRGKAHTWYATVELKDGYIIKVS